MTGERTKERAKKEKKKKKEYTFFLSARGTLSRIDCILGHKIVVSRIVFSVGGDGTARHSCAKKYDGPLPHTIYKMTHYG